MGFGDKYDLRPLKEYVEKNKIMDKFTPKEQEDLKAMAKKLEEFLMADKPPFVPSHYKDSPY